MQRVTSWPMPSISLTSSSPGFRKIGGLRRVADAGRCAGEDQVTRVHRQDVRDVLDDERHVEDQRRRAVVLERHVAEAVGDGEVGRVVELVERHEPRSGRTEPGVRLRQPPLRGRALALQRAVGEVLADREARPRATTPTRPSPSTSGGRWRRRARPRSRWCRPGSRRRGVARRCTPATSGTRSARRARSNAPSAAWAR